MPSRQSLFALVLAVAISFLAALPAYSVQPDEVTAGPCARGTRLRCLVCQNQSIDDSDVPLAKDLRLLVRESLKAGDSDQEKQGANRLSRYEPEWQERGKGRSPAWRYSAASRTYWPLATGQAAHSSSSAPMR